MRVALLILIGLIAGATFEPARADQYRWCAIYSGGDFGGAYNCYFVTLQQCQMAVSGVGGICTPSPFAGTSSTTTPTQTQSKKRN